MLSMLSRTGWVVALRGMRSERDMARASRAGGRIVTHLTKSGT